MFQHEVLEVIVGNRFAPACPQTEARFSKNMEIIKGKDAGIILGGLVC